MTFRHFTDEEMIRYVRTNVPDPSPLEIELCGRLERALDEVDELSGVERKEKHDSRRESQSADQAVDE